jgi:hypothetical protein
LAGDFQISRLQAATLVFAVVPEVGTVDFLLPAGIDSDAIPDQD